MYEGNFAPVGDVAFRAKPRDLFASAKAMRNEADLAVAIDHFEQEAYLRACALWYEDMGLAMTEIRLLPECLAKIDH